MRQGRSGQPIFRDTVNATITSASTSTQVYNVNDVFPSLDQRTIVIEEFLVEIQPAIEANQSQAPLQANVFLNDDGEDINLLASGPFKLVSPVNPTRFRVNIRGIARNVPAILKARSSNSEAPVLSVRLSRELSANEDVSLRITSICRVLPQQRVLIAV